MIFAKNQFALSVLSYCSALLKDGAMSGYGKEKANEMLFEFDDAEEKYPCLLVYITHRMIYAKSITGCDFSRGIEFLEEYCVFLKERAEKGKIHPFLKKKRKKAGNVKKDSCMTEAFFLEWALEASIVSEKKGIREGIRLLNEKVPGLLAGDISGFIEEINIKPYAAEPYEAFARRLNVSGGNEVLKMFFESASGNDEGCTKGVLPILKKFYMEDTVKSLSSKPVRKKSYKKAAFTAAVIVFTMLVTGVLSGVYLTSKKKTDNTEKLQKTLSIEASNAVKSALSKAYYESSLSDEDLTAYFVLELMALNTEDTQLCVDVMESDAQRGVLSVSVSLEKRGDIPFGLLDTEASVHLTATYLEAADVSASFLECRTKDKVIDDAQDYDYSNGILEVPGGTDKKSQTSGSKESNTKEPAQADEPAQAEEPAQTEESAQAGSADADQTANVTKEPAQAKEPQNPDESGDAKEQDLYSPKTSSVKINFIKTKSFRFDADTVCDFGKRYAGILEMSEGAKKEAAKREIIKEFYEAVFSGGGRTSEQLTGEQITKQEELNGEQRK